MLFLFVLALTIFGIIITIYPYFGWYLSIGWQFQNAEPSDFALTMQRIGGFIASVIGVIYLITTIISNVSTFNDRMSWADEFKEKLTTEEVRSIRIGLGGTSLSEEERIEIMSIIRDADIHHVKTSKSNSNDPWGPSHSWEDQIEIIFKDGESESILSVGTEFEISSDVRNTKFVFSSEPLRRWLREWNK